MIHVRKATERGHFNHGWLDTYHTFSFSDYYDPAHMGFRSLRVINDDRVAPGQGFGMHGHRDMEIISYVLEGSLAHKDSTGGESTIVAGDVQRMSAGRGIVHSEFNPSAREPVHFLQIWIQPNIQGIPPSYEEKHFDVAAKRGCLRLIASPDRSEGSLLLHQDCRVYAGLLDGSESARLPVKQARRVYVHAASGSVTANGMALHECDAVKLTEISELSLQQGQAAEVLVFDLPGGAT